MEYQEIINLLDNTVTQLLKFRTMEAIPPVVKLYIRQHC